MREGRKEGKDLGRQEGKQGQVKRKSRRFRGRGPRALETFINDIISSPRKGGRGEGTGGISQICIQAASLQANRPIGGLHNFLFINHLVGKGTWKEGTVNIFYLAVSTFLLYSVISSIST